MPFVLQHKQQNSEDQNHRRCLKNWGWRSVSFKKHFHLNFERCSLNARVLAHRRPHPLTSKTQGQRAQGVLRTGASWLKYRLCGYLKGSARGGRDNCHQGTPQLPARPHSRSVSTPGPGCGSMVEELVSMHKALGSTPARQKGSVRVCLTPATLCL